jgi:hypothetical protein
VREHRSALGQPELLDGEQVPGIRRWRLDPVLHRERGLSTVEHGLDAGTRSLGLRDGTHRGLARLDRAPLPVEQACDVRIPSVVLLGPRIVDVDDLAVAAQDTDLGAHRPEDRLAERRAPAHLYGAALPHDGVREDVGDQAQPREITDVPGDRCPH